MDMDMVDIDIENMDMVDIPISHIQVGTFLAQFGLVYVEMAEEKKHFGWPKVVFEMLYQVFLLVLTLKPHSSIATQNKGYSSSNPSKTFREKKKLLECPD